MGGTDTVEDWSAHGHTGRHTTVKTVGYIRQLQYNVEQACGALIVAQKIRPIHKH